MMRPLLQILFLMILITLQVSFVHALPYPFDHVPLVLIVTVYFTQYANQTSGWWWLMCYGMILDVFVISFAPLEILSYGVASVTMMLLVSHVFTNRSFYGICATALLTLGVLTLSELFLVGLRQLFFQQEFPWWNVIVSQGWSMVFASLLLLFVFPVLRRVQLFTRQTFLDPFS